MMSISRVIFPKSETAMLSMVDLIEKIDLEIHNTRVAQLVAARLQEYGEGMRK